MKFTRFFNFKKPDPLDTVNINDLNDSFDMIDEKLKETEEENKNLSSTFKELIINAGNSNAEIVDARVDKSGKRYDTIGERLDKEHGEVTAQLEQMKNDITKYGAIGNGATACDNAYSLAKTKGNVYFPQNSNNNAVYYFNNDLIVDGINIECDKGVKISIPDTSIISYKKGLISSDLIFISRANLNEFKLINNVNKKINNIVLGNNFEPIIHDSYVFEDSDYIKEVNFATGYKQESQHFANYDSNGMYKVSDGGNPTNKYKYHTLGSILEVGYEYKCLFKFLTKETNSDFKIGVGLFATYNKFTFIGIDKDGKITINKLDALQSPQWSETLINPLGDMTNVNSFNMTSTLTLSARIVSTNKAEIYINSIYLTTIEVLGALKVGFLMNHIYQSGIQQGAGNCLMGRVVKYKVDNSFCYNSLNILVHGDSIGYGFGNSISWADNLKNMLEGYCGITQVNIDNRCTPGEKSNQQLDKFRKIDLTNYTHVIVMLGTNDIQQGNSVDTFVNSIKEFVTTSQNSNKKIIIAIPPHWISKNATNNGFASANYERGEEYRLELIKLQAQYKFTLIDIARVVGKVSLDNYNIVTKDNLHPTDFVQIMISKAFSNAIIYDTNNIILDGKVVNSFPLNLQNNWVHFSGSGDGAVPTIRKNNNYVTVESMIGGGTSTSGTVIANLPLGFRPIQEQFFVVGTNSGFGLVDVKTNGDICVFNGLNSVTWVSMNFGFITN